MSDLGCTLHRTCLGIEASHRLAQCGLDAAQFSDAFQLQRCPGGYISIWRYSAIPMQAYIYIEIYSCIYRYVDRQVCYIDASCDRIVVRLPLQFLAQYLALVSVKNRFDEASLRSRTLYGLRLS